MALLMTTGDCIKKMHRKYQGDTKYPVAGSDDYQMHIDIINDLKDQWATDEDHQWDSNFDEREYAPVTATDLAYDLDTDVNDLSDYVYVDCLGGQTVRFKVIKAKDRHDKTMRAFLTSSNPKLLNFTNMPTGCIGGTIRAGIYFIPPDVKKASDIVPVDRPQWVVIAGAAELAFNDPSKEDKFPDLLGLANDEYQKMADAADTLPQNQVDEVPTEGYIDAGGNLGAYTEDM